ncbi:MAG: hypothetical protein MK137_07300 [Rickettsiales bacterium]|nr:hypothetical protein [Rickettsiales bacterium]
MYHRLCIFMTVICCIIGAFDSSASNLDDKQVISTTEMAASKTKRLSQKEVVVKSCEDGNPKYFPNIKHFQEMCSAIRLFEASPYPPTGYERDTINWRVKIAPNVTGFREIRETGGIYQSYGIFPFVKYINELENKKVYIFGTVTPKHIEQLSSKFFAFYKELGRDKFNIKPDQIGSNIFYRISSEKGSVFNVRKTYRIVNISYSDKAYFVIYTEGLDESELQYFIRQINYGRVEIIHNLLQINPIKVEPLEPDTASTPGNAAQ